MADTCETCRSDEYWRKAEAETAHWLIPKCRMLDDPAWLQAYVLRCGEHEERKDD